MSPCVKAQRGADQSLWNLLPQHLMEIIIHKVAETAGTPEILVMRQVSKCWLAAVANSPRAVQCRVRGSTILSDLSRISPGMTSLEAQCPSLGYLKLNPLAQLAQLTRLSLVGKPHYVRLDDYEGDKIEPLVELNYLPASAKVLEMRCLYADPDCFGGIRCTGLTRLSFKWGQNLHGDVATLLQYFPQLKELECGGTGESLYSEPLEGRNELDLIFYTAMRIPSLTKLRLSLGYLQWGCNTDAGQSSLEELYLEGMTIGLQWISSAVPPFQRLHTLEILDSNIKETRIPGYAGPMRGPGGPVSSLRVLRIRDSPSYCLELAPDSLHSLSYKPCDGGWLPPDTKLAALTALACLELADIPIKRSATAGLRVDLTWLHVKTLEVLIIVRSPEAESLFLASEALDGLRSLRVLHIEEKESSRPSQDYFSAAGPEIAFCSSLLNLPRLQQISGRCRNFQKGMRATPPGWQEVEYNDEKVSELGNLASMQLDVRMWKKQ